MTFSRSIVRFVRAKSSPILFLLITFIAVNLAVEAWYVYKTRHYVRNYYPELYASITKAISRGTDNTRNAGQNPERTTAISRSFFNQRVETFTLLRDIVTDRRTIIFAGDSLIDVFEWSEYFDVKDGIVLNRGVPGDTVQGLLDRFDVTFLPKLRPKVFLMIGINDITLSNICDDGNEGRFLSQYYSLLDRLVQAGIRPQEIFVQSILPVFRPDKSNQVIRSCNRFIKQYSRSKRINYIDIYSSLADKAGKLDRRYSIDGLHLNTEGYRTWLQVIRPYVIRER
jgi:lysophospholipase L1-like esterase